MPQTFYNTNQSMSVHSQLYKPVGNLSAAPQKSSSDYKAFNWTQKCKYLESFNNQFLVHGATKFIATFVIQIQNDFDFKVG